MDRFGCFMQNQEIVFDKYLTRGSDYHWRQINKRLFFAFNSFVFARYHFFVNELKRSLFQKKMNIIDFGCGDGVQLYLIKKALHMEMELFGVDTCEESLRVAKEKTGGTFVKSTVSEVPYEESRFDVAISCDVIEHVLNPEKMIDEMRRVVVHGGIIIIGTPIKYTENPLDAMHVKEFFPMEFAQLFAPEKFEIIKHVQTHPLIYVLLYNLGIRFLKINILPFRYLFNFFTIVFHKNPFEKVSSFGHTLMAYQYIVLKVIK
jgi:SAM-dependent methyltransferase